MNDDIAEDIFNIILAYGFCDTTTNFEQIKCAMALKVKGYLITPHTNDNIYEPSKLGEEVLQNGSWKLYIKAKNKKQKALDDQIHFESRMSKLKYYTFWPALFLGSIGGVHTIIEIVKYYKEDNKTKIESIKEQPKLHISSEDQNKLIYTHSKTVDTAYGQEKTISNNK